MEVAEGLSKAAKEAAMGGAALFSFFSFFFALLMAPRVRSERRDLGFAREKRERDKMRTGHAYGCRPCAGEERRLGLAIWGEGESDFWD